ncbi:M23 family metallopeptidase [Bacillus cereus group sp. BfR-BA-01358]|uniref:M23 family metallopeptidase n=1 Tax=Bacillus cereus group sp. BfR-BA-01358 TaxID=2920320 RepID=UPI001F564D5B|nr:M23 family metallopeptidase [Bacillus cereus group sp. BfR-BA-01358]
MAKFIYPTDTTRVTSGFRGNRPNHHGIDLAEAGYHPIYAAANGKVSRSYFSSSYGECIMIVHTIDGVTWETVYAHMRSGSRTVNVGDYVTQGQTIGVMGNTGDSSGQHLHFELHKGGWNINKSNAVNPLDHLGKGPDPSENKEPSDWAKDAWEWGLEKGIVDGNSHPHGTVLEEILVHMLQRVYNNKVFLGTGSVASVSIDTSYRNGQPSEWARDAWKWGLEKGIVDGNSHPHGEVTEEILVHMLQRIYNNKVFSDTRSTVSIASNVSYQNGEPSEWARDAWKWGLERGIIDENSHPHGKVTEEILVHILQRCTNNGVFN